MKINKNKIYHKSILKILIIIISLYIILISLLSYGNCDAFYPYNLLNLADLVFFGEGGGASIGYQAFVAAFCNLTGISLECILTFPVLTIPRILIIILLVYSLSNNKVVTGIITLMCLVDSFSISNTVQVLWIHSVGSVLFLYFIYIIYLLYSVQDVKNIRRYIPLTLCLLIILLSECIVSYDLLANLCFFLLGVFIIVFFLQIQKKHNSTPAFSHGTKKPFLQITLLLGIFTGAYIVILNPSYLYMFSNFSGNVADGNTISIIDKLFQYLSSYFGVNNVRPTIIDELLLTQQAVFPFLTYVSPIRWLLVGLVILVYLIYQIHLFIKHSHLAKADIIVLSILFTNILCIIIRFSTVGQITYAGLSFPAILICGRFFSMKIKTPIVRIGKIIGILSLIFFIISYGGNYIAATTETGKLETNPGLHGLEMWITDYSSNTISTDVYSMGYLGLMYVIDNYPIKSNYASNKISPFRGYNEILSLIHPEYIKSTNDIVINWALPQISASIADWLTLNSWIKTKECIIGNPNYNIIYSNNIASYLIGR